METVSLVLQAIVGLGIFNVWLLRFNKSSQYRGGHATNLKDEFAVYGIPAWAMYLIGVLKLGAASALFLGIFIPSLTGPAASIIVTLMFGAIVMHIKVKDPLVKSIPAALMLAMGICISLISFT